MTIPFNKPFFCGKEIEYIEKSIESGKISGDGLFSKKCHDFFQNNYGFKKTLLTTSCTDALEMAAILCSIKDGDEVIVPNFTFVSSALAFVRQGANIVFADSEKDHPNIDVSKIENLITSKTKVIVAVHYGGVACDMDKIMNLAKKNNIFVVEDAAQGIESFYKNRRLGSIGHIGTFSFHETKNIICGEGGMIVVNDDHFVDRAEIIREKGTNRSAFFRGDVDKYGWKDIGSSFLPSDILAAFLFAQIENLSKIQNRRKKIWNLYYNTLEPLSVQGFFKLPIIPEYATNNAHMFYIICNSLSERTKLINYLKKYGIMAVFHYQSLHKSNYCENKYSKLSFPNADKFSDCLVRLPLFYELKSSQVLQIAKYIKKFFIG
jgi:dTDP-4-amino-4,6-dideoxygalactose transaminase